MNILDRLSAKKKGLFLALLAALGILLILISTGRENREEKAALEEKNPATLAYMESIENKIRNITEQITGSKEVAVMVSMATGTEYVYVSNEEKEGDRLSTEYIKLRSENGSDSLILQREVYPKVTGISIACRGGDDPVIKQKLISVISTALSVSSNRICIVGTKS